MADELAMLTLTCLVLVAAPSKSVAALQLSVPLELVYAPQMLSAPITPAWFIEYSEPPAFTLVVAAEEPHMRTLVDDAINSVPYTSPLFVLLFIVKLVPDTRESVVFVQVVAEPLTKLLNVPPTLRVRLGLSVKLAALLSVKLLVVVAFCVTVQPPAVESNVRL